MGGTYATHFCVMKPEYFRTFIIYQQPNVKNQVGEDLCPTKLRLFRYL